MADVSVFEPGGYRFMKAVFQYSGGVAAMPGHRIVRVRFSRPVPMAEGFRRIESFLQEVGRPLTAFCACELRSPAPFSESGFRVFNEIYAGTLQRWSIHDGKINPVARSNVCPASDPPSEPSFHAFAYTERVDGAEPSFIVAGGAESPEGNANYSDHIVRRGDTSVDGFREKVRYVLSAMESRLGALGFQWKDTTATQVYTIHDFHPMLADEIVARGAAHSGLTWHYCRPPVIDLEYEMDCRGVFIERVIAA
jgi:hypothetical protein